jgi:hypothetical protein
MRINGSSKSRREAYLFAQFATSKPMDKAHWLKFVTPPARTSNWDAESKGALNPDLFDTYTRRMIPNRMNMIASCSGDTRPLVTRVRVRCETFVLNPQR